MLRVCKKRSRNYITALKDKKGDLQANSNQIVQILENYYEQLYSSTKPLVLEIDNFFEQKFLLKQFTLEHKKVLDNPISEKEIIAVIKNTKINKTPGPDGYPIEFYKLFANLIAPMLKYLMAY